MSVVLSGEGVGYMDFNYGCLHGSYRIRYPDGSMGISRSIEDDAIIFAFRLLDFIDEFPFDIRLIIGELDVLILILKRFQKVVESFCAVNIVFPSTEQVEIGPVNDDYFHVIKIENITGLLNWACSKNP